MTVHLLSHGKSLCSNKNPRGKRWPKHNYWVSVHASPRWRKKVTCTACKAKARKIGATK